MFDPTTCWNRWQPSEAEPWNLARVVHLHRRAAFSPTWDELQRDLADGCDKSIDRILSGTARIAGIRDDFESVAATIGDAAVAAGNATRLKAWWVFRMLYTPDPLAERLALMWHNHFATSNLKVGDAALMKRQNELFRKFGRGKFGDLFARVMNDPAMLVWLDAQANRKEHPNENLARESMELFTLGVGHYSENDVKECARALTGWTVVRGEFQDVPQYHDGEEKTFLGQTGKFNGQDVVRILLAHPATSHRIAWRLCDTFLGETLVDDATVNSLAEGLRAHDVDINWAVGTILRSQVFLSDANIRSKVVSPVEFVVNSVRALELYDPPASTLLLAEQATRLGQDLFYPPNVFGWKGGRDWVNTRWLISRSNFAAALIEGRMHHPMLPFDALAFAKHHGCDPTAQSVENFYNELLLGDAHVAENTAANAAATESTSDEITPDAARAIVGRILTSSKLYLS